MPDEDVTMTDSPTKNNKKTVSFAPSLGSTPPSLALEYKQDKPKPAALKTATPNGLNTLNRSSASSSPKQQTKLENSCKVRFAPYSPPRI